jgi:serine/threonine protein phosphatase PrpC
MKFEYGTVSVRGKSHIETNSPNQDYIQGHNIGETVILVAADGAGTASRSEEGSRRIVNKVLNNLKNTKNKKIFVDPFKYSSELQNIVLESVDELRESLKKNKKESFDLVEKKTTSIKNFIPSFVGYIIKPFYSSKRPFQKTIKVPIETLTTSEESKNIEQSKNKNSLLDELNETELSDYASTFLLIINSPLSTFTAHIGDGYIIGWNRKSDNSEHENKIISLPRNGEYANYTYFFTMDNWKENIIFNSKKEPFDTCLIITDGADKFWIGADKKSIALPLFEGFIKIRENHIDKNLTNVLENVFTFEKISKVDTDDATIGIILR